MNCCDYHRSPITTETTFIGDTILMEYQNSVLNFPKSEAYFPDDQCRKAYCGFAIENQMLSDIKSAITFLNPDGKIMRKVVILLGTFDIMAYLYAHNTLPAIKSNLRKLITFLGQLGAKEIVVCTLPHIHNFHDYVSNTLKCYNDYIRCLPVDFHQPTVKIVDLYSVLSDPALIESESAIPTVEGFQKMDELLNKHL